MSVLEFIMMKHKVVTLILQILKLVYGV